jgi:hypothetical protein
MIYLTVNKSYHISVYLFNYYDYHYKEQSYHDLSISRKVNFIHLNSYGLGFLNEVSYFSANKFHVLINSALC